MGQTMNAEVGQWVSLGPTRINAGLGACGRLTAIAIDPTSPSTMYVGAPGAGVWKTTDGGASWRPVADSLPTLATAALAVDPSAPSRIYVATPGFGVFRSEDAGASWTQLSGVLQAEVRWGDTAGASVDPSDDTAIWVTQAYASDHRTFQHNNWALWVGKLALNTTVVPDCLGLTRDQAQALIATAGLALGRVTTLPPEPPPGRLGPAVVVDQSPLPGTEVNRGTRVDLQLQRQRFVRPSPG